MLIIANSTPRDYATLQEAIDAIPADNREPVTLYLCAGEYPGRVIVNRDHVHIVGEDREGTVITHSGCANDLDETGAQKGTFLSYTFLVTGNDVTVENLTIRNDAGDGRAVGQAVAVYAAGDRGVWRNVRMIAHQDTLFCGPTMPKVARDALPHVIPEGVQSVGDCPPVASRQYFENCFIQGDVDFIFGPYRCWFEGCRLHMNERGGWYTAANTPESSPYGLIFHRCRLTGDCAPGQAFLGRPWRRYAQTYFLHCEMDACVAPEGFQDWADKPVTRRCGEYATLGARADQSPRHPGQARLTDEEAARITLAEVLGDWDPTHRKPAWFLCGDSTMADYSPRFAPMTGWGQTLKPLVPDIYVENCARAGRSSRSFVVERRLDAIARCLRPGDRMFIQFSHNDETTHPERATDPETTYPAYLTMFIDLALAHDVEPVLLTPIARRQFDGAGQALHTHGVYPDVVRRLARQRNIRLLDMERATEQLLTALGDEPSKALFNWQPPGHPNYPEGVQDDTHLSFTGADLLARIALRLFAESE